MNERVARIRRIICDVVTEASRLTASDGVLILDDDTPAGVLLSGWLTDHFGTDRVWRVSALASNVHGVPDIAEARALAALRAQSDRLVAHPASKTALLLGGRLPAADIYPFGDLYATQLAELTGDATVDASLEKIAGDAGGIAMVDAALVRLIDGRQDREPATAALSAGAASALLRRYDAGRWFRTRPLLVPKLGARTIGIDLFD